MPHLDRNYLPAQFIDVADVSLYLTLPQQKGLKSETRLGAENQELCAYWSLVPKHVLVMHSVSLAVTMQPSCTVNPSFDVCDSIREWLDVSEGK